MTVNDRNDQQAELLSSEFVRRDDHLFIYGLLDSFYRAHGGARELYILNRATLNAGNNPVWQGSLRDGALTATLTGAPAALTQPNVNQILSRHGWGGKLRLGETNGFYLFVASTVNDRITGTETHVISTDRGMNAWVALRIPSTANVVGGNKEFMTLWNDDTVNNRAWMLGNAGVAGVGRVRVFLSSNGVASQSFTTTTLSIAAGNSYLIGFSFIPSTSVTIFVNDQFEVRTLDDVGAAPPAGLFLSTANLCFARRDTTAAGTILGSPDAFYYFGGYGSMRMNPAIARAFYEFVKPILLYNTDLGGT